MVRGKTKQFYFFLTTSTIKIIIIIIIIYYWQHPMLSFKRLAYDIFNFPVVYLPCSGRSGGGDMGG